MNKTEFCKILKNVETASRFEDNISKLVRNFNHSIKSEVDWYGFGTILADDVINLLSEIMHDSSQDISYFCWELDFGRDWKHGMITDEDGNDVDFSSAEKLYDFLIRGRKK